MNPVFFQKHKQQPDIAGDMQTRCGFLFNRKMCLPVEDYQCKLNVICETKTVREV